MKLSKRYSLPQDTSPQPSRGEVSLTWSLHLVGCAVTQRRSIAHKKLTSIETDPSSCRI